MTQILVTLENGADSNLIQHIIENIKGVFKTRSLENTTHIADYKSEKSEWLKEIESMSGSFDSSLIDWDDERTKYIMGK